VPAPEQLVAFFEAELDSLREVVVGGAAGGGEHRV